MKVTGPLKEPVLEPCPNRDDMQVLVSDTCQPVQCTRDKQRMGPEMDCCHFWVAPDTWEQSQVRVDKIDPEKFKYEQYRYQLYAKPAGFNCRVGEDRLEGVPDRQYAPPVTDIRALHQTTVFPVMPGGATVAGAGGGIPVVPSNPGGVPEVTFPMTQATLGQPDVTTACCVPVVPCQQGYQNLTRGIKPGPKCKQPPPPGRPFKQQGPKRPDPCAEGPCVTNPTSQQQQGAGGVIAPQQYVMPPSNQQGCGCDGLPPTFPQRQHAYSAPQVQQLQVPEPHFPSVSPAGGQQHQMGYSQGGECLDTQEHCIVTGLEDGLNPRGGADSECTNVSTFRYPERILREYNAVKETEQERRQRLQRMSGAYGSALQAKQTGRRSLAGPKDNIQLQGNGFSWGGYPKHQNRLCYVLERNQRC